MKSLARTAAAAAAAGALTLLAAPASQAAPSAASACVTAADQRSFGRGEISLCPQSDGTTRVTGYVEDLLPGSGWGAPDGRCAGWYLHMGPDDGMIGPIVCPHFSSDHQAKKTFDYAFKPASPVTSASLGAFSL
ncbi:hypothetical protein BLA24_02085 [Streptomyces cinnamoneus]|uniref:Secreted protein n=1 Tax=Streptomyces cinnamoneus TaxID=53446 RepID=A0A2G1XPK8_STRCJ|nr:hypothetical protein [Streptomyces cinnamoneus]PHQ53156.1 hypothetical protein BLA24_02085 [Streptomyces cinnamoneus]PPT12246.1 hypothetical protein CYQ11_04450 [Streptomyces cinnamoneus]